LETKGKHLIADALGCRSDVLNDADRLQQILTKAVEALGMKILSTQFHSFTPQGVTGTIIISTSHFSIHTWPERGYAALDFYTCGNVDLWGQLKHILGVLEAKSANVYDLERGEDADSPVTKKRIRFAKSEAAKASADTAAEKSFFQLRDERGNAWDMIQLREIVKGGHNILFQGASPYQEILLIEASDLRLYLNQELQFSSLDERSYHEALVHPAMGMASTHGRVLVLGGGDGLGLREVLKYPQVVHVDLVDIDPIVLEIAKTVPALVEQNRGSFLDQRVHVHAQDAKQFLSADHPPYDVIIIDFPDPVDRVISTLYKGIVQPGVTDVNR
jgi:spermidine synthase